MSCLNVIGYNDNELLVSVKITNKNAYKHMT